MRVISECSGDAGQFTEALDENLLRAVHQNVADGEIAEQRLERTESSDLVKNLLDDVLAISESERG